MSSASPSSGSASSPPEPSTSASAASKSNRLSKVAASKPLASLSKVKKKRRSSTKLFTPLMQEAQARNKDPYAVFEDEDSDASMDWHGDERFTAYGYDNFERTQKKRGAACILDNPELIMMYSLARGDSIPGTRNFLMKTMCGYFDPNEKDDCFEPGTEKEEERQKLKPWTKDFDRQGRPWDSGNWGMGSPGPSS